jgi:hypothetical protein
MQSNLIALANTNKIKNNVKTLDVDTTQRAREELIPDNSDATTIGDDTNKYEEKKHEKKKEKKHKSKRRDIFDLNKISKPVSDSDTESEPDINNRIDDNDEDDLIKARIRRNIKKMRRTAGVDIPTNLEGNSLHELKGIEQMAKSNMIKRRKAVFVWNIIYITCISIESLFTRIGYGIRFNGWVGKVKDAQATYMELINEMLMDEVYIDKETGEKVIIKNKGFMANLEISPVINIILTLFISAITHVGASNIYNLMKAKKTLFGKHDNDDEEAMMNLAIPDEDENKFSVE